MHHINFNMKKESNMLDSEVSAKLLGISKIAKA